MFGWLGKRQQKPAAQPQGPKPRSAADALTLLASVQGRFRSGGPDAVQVCADGLARVAGAVAGRLGADLTTVLRGDLTFDQLHVATGVLAGLAAEARPRMDTSIAKDRTAAQGVAGGCLLMAELVRLKLQASGSDEGETTAAENVTVHFRQFILHLAEVADGSRDPTTMI
jgi:hypothetical protein